MSETINISNGGCLRDIALILGIIALWGYLGSDSDEEKIKQLMKQQEGLIEKYMTPSFEERKKLPLKVKMQLDIYNELVSSSGTKDVGGLLVQKELDLQKQLPVNPETWTIEEKDAYAWIKNAQFIRKNYADDNRFIQGVGNELISFNLIQPQKVQTATVPTASKTAERVKGE